MIYSQEWSQNQLSSQGVNVKTIMQVLENVTKTV